MTSWIQRFTKEIFMKIGRETFWVPWKEKKIQGIKVMQLKWSGIRTKNGAISLLPEKAVNNCIGFWTASITHGASKCFRHPYMLLWMHVSLIETSLSAQAPWVDVSSGLGRNPPCSYPSREQFAAKLNLGFTALNKPSLWNRPKGRQRQRRRDKGVGRSGKNKNSMLIWHK